MGLKKKYAKGRLDKYYHMAKEQGYRARSAFKLIQLNKKYNLLSGAKVLVDLCAAPGGWLQVAAKYMPSQSLIIGLDLAPIKPIPNVITHVEDITTAKCRATLKNELKSWKADVFLHDGAPNVGTAWLQDAYSQAELVLHSLKLATEFLMENGSFVTKVFRSKDYNKLIWVFNQLFTKVEATKPSSSRNVSAEIFVVCQGYKAPKKIDPRLMDPKWVFRELDDLDGLDENEAGSKKLIKEKQGAILNDLLHPEKRRRHRDGYDTSSLIIHTSASVLDFVQSPTGYLDILSRCNQLEFSSDDFSNQIKNHPITTEEIKELLGDLRVLGKKEFKQLIKWRESIRLALGLSKKDDDKEVEEEEEQEETLDEIITKEEEKVHAEAKRLKRKQREKKAKSLLRLRLGMETPADIGIDAALDMGALPDIDEQGMDMDVADFSDEETKSAKDSKSIDIEEEDDLYDSDEELAHKIGHLEHEMDHMYEMYKNRKVESNAAAKVKKAKEGAGQQFEEWYGIEYEKNKRAMDDENDSEEEDDENDDDHIVTMEEADDPALSTSKEETSHKENKQQKVKSLSTDARLFFDNPVFDILKQSESTQISKKRSREEDDDISADEDSEEDISNKDHPALSGMEEDEDEDIPSFNPVPMNDEDEDGDDLPLIDSAAAYTLAQQLVTKKGKRDAIDNAFNRYAFNDPDDLPEWFMEDENRHNKPSLPVTKEAVELMKQRYRALDARPIKKVAEAKFRKQLRATKRLERIAKKAEGVADDEELNEKSKLETISKMVAKVKAKNKQQREKPKLVVAKGANRGVKGRPRGVKGRYKIVDSRMKKDLRADKANAKKSKKRRR